MAIADHQNVQNNDLRIDKTKNAATGASTSTATEPFAFAPPSTSSPKSIKLNSTNQSNPLDVSFNDSLVEKLAAELAQDPNALDKFIQLLE